MKTALDEAREDVLHWSDRALAAEKRAGRLADEVANLEVIRGTLTAEVERLRAARVGVCVNCYHVDAVYFDGEADVCVRFDVCQARQQVGRR